MGLEHFCQNVVQCEIIKFQFLAVVQSTCLHNTTGMVYSGNKLDKRLLRHLVEPITTRPTPNAMQCYPVWDIIVSRAAQMPECAG